MPTAPKVTATEVGRVALGDDDAVVVTILRRTWPASDNEHSGRKTAATVAPVAVEVRRHPYPGDLFGGVTAANARLLANLISRAADEADPAGVPRPATRSRRAR